MPTALEELKALPVDRMLALGVDVGGTQIGTGLMTGTATDGPITVQGLTTADYGLFDDVLIRTIRELGRRPGKVYAALPGLIKDGRVTPTNIKRWGEVCLPDIAEALGIAVDGGSDMAAKAVGARAANSALRYLIDEGVTEPGTRLYVTWSTGMNSIFEVLEPGKTYRFFKAESGHVTWQAQTAREERYLRYLRRLYRTKTITAERACSGSHGFRNACMFMLADQLHPSNWFRSDSRPGASLRKALCAALKGSSDVGPLIDDAAAAGNPFALAVIELVASIFGDYLRTLALVELPSDGIVITGGVATGEHFRELYAQHVYDRLVGRGAEFDKELARTEVRFANRVTNAQLGPRGAAILASQLGR